MKVFNILFVLWFTFYFSLTNATDTFYTEYLNGLFVGKTSNQEDVVLISGSHNKSFPYKSALPWDSGLILIGDRKYSFTQRINEANLIYNVDTSIKGTGSGSITYNGLVFEHTKEKFENISINIMFEYKAHPTQNLGSPINYLNLISIAGFRWHPFEVTMGYGFVYLDNKTIRLDNFHGELEKGEYRGLDARKFDIDYDYVVLAKANTSWYNSDGYTFVDFETRALRRSSFFGKILDWYLRLTGSRTYTFYNNSRYDENYFNIYRPKQSDKDVVIFENNVDLTVANLRRQLIKSIDGNGETVYGMREIFEAK